MNWFTGSIPEAIGLAKATDAIFVVYVYDSSEASTATNETLEEKELATVLNSKKFVAIKIENGTEPSKQFSQIYPVVVLPSLYFISGSTGMPLEILGGTVTKEKLKEKLDHFTKDDEATSNNLTQGASGSAEEKMDVEEAATSTAAPDTSSSTSASMVTTSSEPQVEEPQSVSEDGDGLEDDSSVPLEDRVERAKELLAEKQVKKAEEKFEEQRKSELDRRKTGQEIAKRKRQMYEDEVQTAARERKKEKEEDKAARERVRAQIAADRLEREMRAAQRQGDVAPPVQESAANVAPAAAAPTPNRNETVTRLKFRLSDGSASVVQFPLETTLSEVRQHVQQLVSSSSFTLSSTVHQRPFTADDSGSTLLELGLVPAAVIVVLLNPRTPAGGGVISSSGGIMQILWMLISPITFLLGFVRQLFLGGRGAPPPSSNETPAAGFSGATTSQQRPSTAYGVRSRENVRHREGNIHRLHNSNDDDENNTWNGNSTQQM